MESFFVGSQTLPVRTTTVAGVPPAQAFNAAATPATFFGASNAQQHVMQNYPQLGAQALTPQNLLQAQAAQQVAQMQMVQAQQLAQYEAQRQYALSVGFLLHFAFCCNFKSSFVLWF